MRARQQVLRTSSVRECGPKLVADERERAEPEHGVRVLRAEPHRSSERGLGSRQVGSVSGLAPAELVREPELGQRARVPRL